MSAVICGATARSFWRAFNGNVNTLPRCGSLKLEKGPTTKARLEETIQLFSRMAFTPDVAELIVPRSARGARCKGAVLWSPSHAFSDRSFVRLSPDVIISSPELSLLEACRSMECHEAIEYGFQLCGSFSLDENARSGTGSRPALTTVRKVANFLESNRGLVKSRSVEKVLACVLEKSASPQESRLAMKLCLPSRLGGFGLPPCTMNHRINHDSRKAGPSARSHYRVDLCWPEQRVAVEYDSAAEHLSEFQHTRDVLKQTALRNMGYTTITVTKAQINGKEAMRVIAREIAKALGVRLRTQSRKFPQQQAVLFSLR